ncbi:MAG: serine/threonine protein kinase, partial [Myxococcales bacterium]
MDEPVGRFAPGGPERRGAQGKVQRAVDRSTGGEVALKRPVDLEPAAVAGFLREASLLASVRHPAVVAHVDHGVDPVLGPFLATAWVEGVTLAERVGDARLTPDDLAPLGARLADGLAALHAAGICHGDVQPANVMLAGDGAPVLLDLGLSGRRGPPGPGAARGTAGFVAPEVILGGRLEPASDVFGLGALLWFA